MFEWILNTPLTLWQVFSFEFENLFKSTYSLGHLQIASSSFFFFKVKIKLIEAYSEPFHTSKVELFAIIVNDWNLLQKSTTREKIKENL